MKQGKDTAVYWNRPYGWRAGSRNIEPGASAVDVIRFEQEELGNTLDVPVFLLAELQEKQVKAREIVWVCRTRDHARRYGGAGIGQPYKEDFGSHALILTTDNETETGYLVLFDARLLSPTVIQQYTHYRREKPLVQGASVKRSRRRS
jgi:hypothetical protein